MQRVDTFGSAWQTLAGHAPPTIFGDVRRDHDTITGIRVGVSAKQSNPSANALDVTAEEDAVLVPRLPGEPLYAGLEASLVQRCADLHGTSRAWLLVYR